MDRGTRCRVAMLIKIKERVKMTSISIYELRLVKEGKEQYKVEEKNNSTRNSGKDS